MIERLSNGEMEARAAAIAPFLDRRDMIGYAAARNTRALADALVEYRAVRDSLVLEHGEEEVDDGGRPTGRVHLDPASESFGAFAEAIAPYMGVEHDVEVFRIPYSEAVGSLTGSELLAADWMFEEA